MPRIVFLDVDAEDAAHVRARYPDAHISSGILSDEQIAGIAKDAEVVSTFIRMPFQKSLLEKLPRLTLLCTRSVGFNHIDLDVCKKRGITVCHVPDYGSHVIAEHVFALLLSTLRHIPEADRRVESGEFDYHGLRGVTLRGKTLGIVGTGKIGRRVAQIARGFGMKILATDLCRDRELEEGVGVLYVPFEDLLRQSDMITLHVPALKETTHMIGDRAFGLMKPGVILVNTARGELIDSPALLRALSSEKVRYALLDVFEHEKNFQEDRALIEHPNVVATPHIAFYAEESMRNMYEDSFQSIDQFLRGEVPEHVVKPPKLVCDLDGVK